LINDLDHLGLPRGRDQIRRKVARRWQPPEYESILADFAAAETLVIDLDQEACALGLGYAAGPMARFFYRQ